MSEKKTGGPAFPGVESPAGGYPGMTLRDYFAAHALIGLIIRDRDVVADAFEIADAMLAERDK